MSRVDTAIKATAGVTVVGLAGIAGAISYSHMTELAHLHGETGWRAHMFPLSVDGIEIVASLVLLADKLAGRRSGWLPWAALVAGTGASFAANVAVGAPTGSAGWSPAGRRSHCSLQSSCCSVCSNIQLTTPRRSGRRPRTGNRRRPREDRLWPGHSADGSTLRAGRRRRWAGCLDGRTGWCPGSFCPADGTARSETSDWDGGRPQRQADGPHSTRIDGPCR